MQNGQRDSSSKLSRKLVQIGGRTGSERDNEKANLTKIYKGFIGVERHDRPEAKETSRMNDDHEIV